MTCSCSECEAKRKAALASMPAPVREAFEEGAVPVLAAIGSNSDDDLDDVPFGSIAAGALAGFFEGLGFDWSLVGPGGVTISAQDMRFAFEAIDAECRAEDAAAEEASAG